jgi:hypothetical protein
MLSVPLPKPKPPVGPVETGTMVVMKVGGLTPPAAFPPPLELPPVAAMAEPGIYVVTLLNATGLKPAPKPPVPEEVVMPPKLRVPTPSMFETVPSCEPVPLPAAFPPTRPKALSTKPDAPLVVVKFPVPVAVEIPVLFKFWADPVPVAIPPLVAIPLAIPPPGNAKFCNLLDPLRLWRVIVLLLEDAS